ncbi:4-(cytidine 5'-diphospho)-2-C-methyl-D-erythritol kinase [Nocardioides acrostichi]|uniref:4-diphosphocytidyl-2-C-methyl-D-erythritol kinase n=1 Tax=Nocardioides acrostichi TaxID=2784339 RepID=A0A930V0K5_9ACTN|nr:4-(cytidine 5'-diphospho)-2-C-methyl-D-erythritol kinase [Nocardioides acrostichi]MBF4161641.1 4-(cytidine 5'-diphospho)-2-C-methyl-D-erythritol kinase [Nocardioides acrostichi]
MSLAYEPEPPSVTVRAPAKINLHLGVGARRDDGFHPLATVYQAVGLYDDVTLTLDEEWGVSVRHDAGRPAAIVPLDEQNLAVRAAQMLLAHHGVDGAAAVHIRKSIPVAGGMAGGSADAAAALVATDRLFDLETSDDDLLAVAARLGSDVPFALLGGTAIGTGRGELVEPITDAGSWWWVVVGSDDALSTPQVYRSFDDLVGAGAPTEPVLPPALLLALETGDVGALADHLGNDLAEPALRLLPTLRDTFDDAAAAGARATLLSGSGPTVLLLCSDGSHAREVTAAMAERGHEHVVAVPAPVSGTHVLDVLDTLS